MMTKFYVNAVALLNQFKRDERGVTAIEYGLIGVAMAVVLAGVLGTGEGNFLGELTEAFGAIGEAISGAIPTTDS